MKKIILSSEECERLKPSCFELDENKLRKLETFSIRGSRHKGRNDVISVPPILIAEDGFILNGNHRSFAAASSRNNIEACVVANENDLRHHIPKECLRDSSIDSLREMFSEKMKYINLTNLNGISNIRDLMRRNEREGRSFLEMGNLLKTPTYTREVERKGTRIIYYGVLEITY